MVVGEEGGLEEGLEEVRMVGMVRWIVGRIGKRVERVAEMLLEKESDGEGEIEEGERDLDAAKLFLR